jgi:hypothetical protein
MNNNMKTKDKAKQFRTAWTELVPTASLAGMTLGQFEASIAILDTLQDEITSLAIQLDHKRTERAIEEARIKDLLVLVASSIKGSPEHGRDSALYSAFGFIRQSDRKSGLHRLPAVVPVVTPSGIVMGSNNGTGGINAA